MIIITSIMKVFTKKRVALIIFVAFNATGLAHAVFSRSHTLADTIPAEIRGNFNDDYGISYSISDSLWVQHPNIQYHIISCDTAAKYILAKNHADNPGEKGLYTRIDYMSFSNMAPFKWGFCLTVYDAKTIEEARTKAVADRLNPKKGCGGFPFSRMKNMD